MDNIIRRWFAWLIWPCLLCLTASTGTAQEGLKPDHADRFGMPEEKSFKTVGVVDGDCARCHVKGPDPFLPPNLRQKNDGWFLGNEVETYFKHDHHYQAYSVLLNPQSKEIAKRLNIVNDQGESLVHQSKDCLACHSSVPWKQMEGTENLVESDTSKDPLYTIGVSCEACHGPAGEPESGGWNDAHKVPAKPNDTSRWRWLSASEKFEKHGYWDVHSTRTQTRICLSCHLGNIEQKKVITHEMYAAGHPPLPSFELSQFIHQMPRHWRRLDEKEAKLREDYEAHRGEAQDAGIEGYPAPSQFPEIRASSIAALVALEESMKLVADSIGDSESSSPWPELANYACFNCHHELKLDGWRRTRTLTPAPGRPTLHEWPFALPGAVANTPSLDLEIKGVITALNSRPYGNDGELKEAATALAIATKGHSRRLSKDLELTEDRAADWLKRLANIGATRTHDYDSARQLVWAYVRAQADLQKDDVSEGGVPEIEIPKKWMSKAEAFSPLEDHLILWLRGNRPEKSEVSLSVGDQTYESEIFAIDVAEVLRKISAYDPKLTREAFGKLQTQPTFKPDK